MLYMVIERFQEPGRKKQCIDVFRQKGTHGSGRPGLH